ncbi:MAG TPA: serine--tRNA ligase, partial [Coriobacteriia bacterium]
ADRGGIRFKRDATARPEHPHILNASGVALPRLMISIIENYQQSDGSVVIPSVVRPYLRGRQRIEPGEFQL